MSIETSRIIIDDNLELDINTGIIGNNVSKTNKQVQVFPTEEIMLQLDRLEESVSDLESSFDSNTMPRLSNPGREGIYATAGLLTNIVLGIIITLFLIILII